MRREGHSRTLKPMGFLIFFSRYCLSDGGVLLARAPFGGLGSFGVAGLFILLGCFVFTIYR